MGLKHQKRHHGASYKRWQQYVFQKGHYKCSKCGSTENLTADHIKPQVTHPELRLKVGNGRILCEKCRIGDMLDSLQEGKFRGRLKCNSGIKGG